MTMTEITYFIKAQLPHIISGSCTSSVVVALVSLMSFATITLCVAS